MPRVRSGNFNPRDFQVPSEQHYYDSHTTSASNDDTGLSTSSTYRPPRRPPSYSINSDLLHSFANRILHSHYWKAFYVCMLALSLACLAGTYLNPCPGPWICTMEIIVNMGMVAEVCVRFVALGKIFWLSYWNIVDLALVPLCLLTFVIILFTPCSASSRGELELEDMLLVFRNGVVLSRLASVVQKNRTQLGAQTRNIDLLTIDPMGDVVPGGRALPLWDVHMDGMDDFI
ncbi:hypothetical protein HDU86_006645 [Geranomyces michiganensis]|nr:hypothetical protein HDU86_006645 [Geranomyces michiganensis]